MIRSGLLIGVLCWSLSGIAHELSAITITKTVAAPVATVWDLWTTETGLRSFFGSDAHVDLQTGGSYEVLFDTSAPIGYQGSEGCTVISMDQQKRLQFSWNAPPKFGEAYRKCNTQVTVTMEEIAPYTTKITLTHEGWGDGGKWPDIHSYFTKAWGYVMDQLEKRCEKEWMRDFTSWVGLWKTMDGREIYEEWKLGDNKLEGSSFTRKDEQRIHSEDLELIWKPDGVYYTPAVMNQNNGNPIPFKLVKMDGTSWTFENPEHDFPQQIIYQRIGNELKAYVKGMMNGKEKVFTFTYSTTRL